MLADMFYLPAFPFLQPSSLKILFKEFWGASKQIKAYTNMMIIELTYVYARFPLKCIMINVW